MASMKEEKGLIRYTDRLSLPSSVLANDTIVLELQEDQNGGDELKTCLEVHKVILAASSTVFCDMFEADAGCRVIQVTGSWTAWDTILTRIYPYAQSTSAKPSADQIFEMLPVAHKYNFKVVLTDCLSWASEIPFSADLDPIPWIVMAGDLQLEELACAPLRHIIAAGIRVAMTKAMPVECAQCKRKGYNGYCYDRCYNCGTRSSSSPAPNPIDVKLLQNVSKLSLSGLPIAVHVALAELANALRL